MICLLEGSHLLCVSVFDDLQAFDHVTRTKSFHRPEWRQERDKDR